MYGPSTDWLGRVVEALSGLSLDAYFRRRIFAPLEMSDTLYDVPRDKQARLVAAHRRQANGSAGEAARAAASNRFQAGRRRRPVVNGQRLPPLHPYAPQRRRARRRPHLVVGFRRHDGGEIRSAPLGFRRSGLRHPP